MKVCPKCKNCLITKHSASQSMCDGCYFKSTRDRKDHSSMYHGLKGKKLDNLVQRERGEVYE